MKELISIDRNIKKKESARPKTGYKSGKSSFDSLSKYKINDYNELNHLDEGLYTFSDESFEYDFIYKSSEENRLFVLLSGYADRGKLEPPVFQRWSWSHLFPGHCLYIADPTIKPHSDMGIAWYCGTQEAEVIPTILGLVKKVADNIGVSYENVIFYGSSGGGFASLKLTALLPESSAVVINPQIDVTKYDNGSVLKLLKRCFGGVTRDEALEQFKERFSLIPYSDRLKERRIFYIQNTLDKHHYEVHLPLFTSELNLNEMNDFKNNDIEVFFFAHPDGHSMQEPVEVFDLIMNRIT
ncbi:hypothetical protein [Alkalihalobacterium bogoriense]|uniref:hypothetical protein n=1 Tax=Alkalihalobacterium bogoriense TaxID=246272 RepID=UPI00047DB128|nr:hypothetical protein [Alkalihalobacterium bogoriense]